MDLTLKFLIMGGKYLSQLTAQSILEAYRRSIQLSRSLNHQCSQSLSVITNYTSILELYNENLEELEVNPNAHLAFISDQHRQEFMAYLSEAQSLTEEAVQNLFSESPYSDIVDSYSEDKLNYARQMALSIINSSKNTTTNLPSLVPISDKSQTDSQSMDSRPSSADLLDLEQIVEEFSVNTLPAQASTDFARNESMKHKRRESLAMNYYSEKQTDIDEHLSVINHVAEFLDRQSEYIKCANDTFRKLQLDISLKYHQMRQQQLQKQELEDQREIDFANKLKAVQKEVEHCTKLMKYIQGHFDVTEEDIKAKRLFMSIDKIIKDVEDITVLMNRPEKHFKLDSLQNMQKKGKGVTNDEISRLMDVNLNAYNRLLCSMVNQKLSINQPYSTAAGTSAIISIDKYITGFLTKYKSKETEKLMEINQRVFEEYEQKLKYPLIGRWNNRIKRKRSLPIRDKANGRNTFKKKYKGSRNNGGRKTHFMELPLQRLTEEPVCPNYAALSSSWIKDDDVATLEAKADTVSEKTPSSEMVNIQPAIENFLSKMQPQHKDDTKQPSEKKGVVVVDEKLDNLVEELMSQMSDETTIPQSPPPKDNKISDIKKDISTKIQDIRYTRTSEIEDPMAYHLVAIEDNDVGNDNDEIMFQASMSPVVKQTDTIVSNQEVPEFDDDYATLMAEFSEPDVIDEKVGLTKGGNRNSMELSHNQMSNLSNVKVDANDGDSEKHKIQKISKKLDAHVDNTSMEAYMIDSVKNITSKMDAFKSTGKHDTESFRKLCFPKMDVAKMEAIRKNTAKKNVPKIAKNQINSDNVKIDAAKVEDTKSETSRTEGTRPMSFHMETFQFDVNRSETARAEAAKNKAAKIAATRIEAARIESEKAEAARLEAKRREIAYYEALRRETGKINIMTKFDTDKMDAKRKEMSKIEAFRSEDPFGDLRKADAAAMREAVKAEAAKLEKNRIEAEKLKAAAIEAKRVEQAAMEAKRAEQARIEAARLKEQARIEAARLKAAKVEASRLEAKQRELEKIEAAKQEAARIQAAKIEAAKLEHAKFEAKLEKKKLETARLQTAKAEAARIKARKIEYAKIEAARLRAVQQQISKSEALKLTTKKVDVTKIEAAKKEAAKIMASRAEAARLAMIKAEKEKAEAARIQAKQQKIAKMKIARMEAAKAMSAMAAAARLEARQKEILKIEAAKAEAARIAAAKREQSKLNSERPDADENEVDYDEYNTGKLYAPEEIKQDQSYKIATKAATTKPVGFLSMPTDIERRVFGLGLEDEAERKVDSIKEQNDKVFKVSQNLEFTKKENATLNETSIADTQHEDNKSAYGSTEGDKELETARLSHVKFDEKSATSPSTTSIAATVRPTSSTTQQEPEKSKDIDIHCIMAEVNSEINEKELYLAWEENNKLLDLAKEMNARAEKFKQNQKEESQALANTENFSDKKLTESHQNLMVSPMEKETVVTEKVNEQEDELAQKISESKSQGNIDWIESYVEKRDKAAKLAPVKAHKSRHGDASKIVKKWNLAKNPMQKKRKSSRSNPVIRTNSNEITLVDMINGGTRIAEASKASTRQISFSKGSINFELLQTPENESLQGSHRGVHSKESSMQHSKIREHDKDQDGENQFETTEKEISEKSRKLENASVQFSSAAMNLEKIVGESSNNYIAKKKLKTDMHSHQQMENEAGVKEDTPDQSTDASKIMQSDRKSHDRNRSYHNIETVQVENPDIVKMAASTKNKDDETLADQTNETYQQVFENLKKLCAKNMPVQYKTAEARKINEGEEFLTTTSTNLKEKEASASTIARDSVSADFDSKVYPKEENYEFNFVQSISEIQEEESQKEKNDEVKKHRAKHPNLCSLKCKIKYDNPMVSTPEVKSFTKPFRESLDYYHKLKSEEGVKRGHLANKILMEFDNSSQEHFSEKPQLQNESDSISANSFDIDDSKYEKSMQNSEETNRIRKTDHNILPHKHLEGDSNIRNAINAFQTRKQSSICEPQYNKFEEFKPSASRDDSKTKVKSLNVNAIADTENKAIYVQNEDDINTELLPDNKKYKISMNFDIIDKEVFGKDQPATTSMEPDKKQDNKSAKVNQDNIKDEKSIHVIKNKLKEFIAEQIEIETKLSKKVKLNESRQPTPESNVKEMPLTPSSTKVKTTEYFKRPEPSSPRAPFHETIKEFKKKVMASNNNKMPESMPKPRAVAESGKPIAYSDLRKHLTMAEAKRSPKHQYRNQNDEYKSNGQIVRDLNKLSTMKLASGPPKYSFSIKSNKKVDENASVKIEDVTGNDMSQTESNQVKEEVKADKTPESKQKPDQMVNQQKKTEEDRPTSNMEVKVEPLKETKVETKSDISSNTHDNDKKLSKSDVKATPIISKTSKSKYWPIENKATFRQQNKSNRFTRFESKPSTTIRMGNRAQSMPEIKIQPNAENQIALQSSVSVGVLPRDELEEDDVESISQSNVKREGEDKVPVALTADVTNTSMPPKKSESEKSLADVEKASSGKEAKPDKNLESSFQKVESITNKSHTKMPSKPPTEIMKSNGELNPESHVVLKADPVITSIVPDIVNPIQTNIVDMTSITCVQYLNKLSYSVDNTAYSHLMEILKDPAKSALSTKADLTRSITNSATAPPPNISVDKRIEQETFLVNNTSTPTLKSSGKRLETKQKAFKLGQEVFIYVDSIENTNQPLVKTLSKNVLNNLRQGSTNFKQYIPETSKKIDAVCIAEDVSNAKKSLNELKRGKSKDRNMKRLNMDDKNKKVEATEQKKTLPVTEKVVENNPNPSKFSKFSESKFRPLKTHALSDRAKTTDLYYRTSSNNIKALEPTKMQTHTDVVVEKPLRTSKSELNLQEFKDRVEKFKSAVKTSQSLENLETPQVKASTRRNVESAEINPEAIPVHIPLPKLPLSRKKNIIPSIPELKNIKIVIPKMDPSEGKSFPIEETEKENKGIITSIFKPQLQKPINVKPLREVVTAPTPQSSIVNKTLNLMKSESGSNLDRKSKNFLKTLQNKVQEHIDGHLMKKKREQERNWEKKFAPRFDLHTFTNEFGKELAKRKAKTEIEKETIRNHKDEYQRQLTQHLQSLSALPKLGEKKTVVPTVVYKPPPERGIREVTKPSLSEMKRTIMKHLRVTSPAPRPIVVRQNDGGALTRNLSSSTVKGRESRSTKLHSLKISAKKAGKISS